jgi:hypothetical protein
MYQMAPVDHIKAAEVFAHNAATDRPAEDEAWRQRMATLALAHATIALAQMTGSQRA